MINNLSILLSLIVVGYTVLKAIKLDKTEPWFGKVRPYVARGGRR